MFPSSRVPILLSRRSSYLTSLNRSGDVLWTRSCCRPVTGRSVGSNETPFTIGILRESYDKWERRVPLTPKHVQQFLDTTTGSSYSSHGRNVLVQPSSHRIFLDKDYERVGATIQEDLSMADLILGVKRPKSEQNLLPHKTYMFFSHVIKGQPENMSLLQEILKKNVQLIDYECILQQQEQEAVHENDSSNKNLAAKTKKKRLVAFGKYAGIAGMVDTFQALGRRLLAQSWMSTPFLNCPPTLNHVNMEEVKKSVQLLGDRIRTDGLPRSLEPIVFAITGKGGKVHDGVREILDLLPHENISVSDLPKLFEQHAAAAAGSGHSIDSLHHKVYCLSLNKEDVYKKKTNPSNNNNNNNTTDDTFDMDDFKQNPSNYESTFAQTVAPYIHVLINCAYWDSRFPRLLTKKQIKRLHESGNERLMLVSDISCDVNGSIEFLDRTTTIDKPFYQYDPVAGREVSDIIDENGITMMGVDILPAELPADSSSHFGDAVSQVLNELTEGKDETGIAISKLTPRLSNACITTSDGTLSTPFRYLDSIVKRTPKLPITDSSNVLVVALEGHLFDSGLMNQILDAIDQHGCGFAFKECHVRAKPVDGERMKSHAVLKITGGSDSDISKLESKIFKLVDLIESAEATCNRIDRNRSRAEVKNMDSKRVLILGSGRVSRSAVDALGRSESRTIIVASDNEQEAKAVASYAKRGEHTGLDIANDPQRLQEVISDADVVISFLPVPLHPQIAELCIQNRKDMVTASYESDGMRKLGPRAEDAGIKILNEVGLDPGLDHMSAMKIIDDIRERGGVVTSFRSVCGGLPAPEAADNPLKYKFSWSPRGVISASKNSARYRMDDKLVEIDGRELLRNATPFDDAWPEVELECLPNRDSLVYENKYGLESAKTIFRGTLRYRGYCSIMNVFSNMGLFEPHSHDASTWEDLLTSLQNQQANHESLDDFLRSCAHNDGDDAMRARHCLEWLGMLQGPIKQEGDMNVLDLVCNILEDKLKFEAHEQDLILMHHAIDAEFEGGTVENHQSSLQVYGSQSMSAMCKTVGYTTAAATDLMLNGTLEGEKGLLLPIQKVIYDPILAAVKREGIVFSESVSMQSSQPNQKVV